MPTPVYICGAECGLAAAGTASGGVEHWSTFPAAGSIETSILPGTTGGVRAYKVNPSAAVSLFTHTLTTAANVSVARVYIRFGVFPGANYPVFHVNRGGTFFGVGIKSTGQLVGFTSSTYGTSGPTLSTDTWYRLDVNINTGANPWTMDWQVDGSAQTQWTQATAGATHTSINFGQGTNATTTWYWDDLCVSATSGDYPIGEGTVAGLYPVSDSTHTYLTGPPSSFLDGGTAQANLATAASETSTWQSLTNPLSTTIDTTKFLTNATGTTAHRLQWVADNLPGAASTVNGVMSVSTHHAASATGNTTCFHVIDISASGALVSNIVTEMAVAGTLSPWTGGLDLSETTICTHVSCSAAGAATGAWTVANVNDLGWAWGSTDVTPDVYLDGVCLEVDYVGSTGDTAPAELASATGTAYQPSGTLNAGIGHSSATGIARQPAGGIGASAGQASATATAFNATVQVTAGIGHASATGTANQAAGGGGVSAGRATAFGAGGDEYVRHFTSASSEKIDLALGAGGSLTGACTLAAIVRKNTDGVLQRFVSIGSVNTNSYGLQFAATNLPGFRAPGGIGSPTDLTQTVTVADGWILIVASRPAGTGTQERLHIYKYATGVWFHGNGDVVGGTNNATPSGSSALGYRIDTAANYFNGDIAIAGVVGSNLSDAQVETLALDPTAWTGLLTNGRWPLTQSSTATAVTDTTGNSADQTAITGTSVSLIDPAGWALNGLDATVSTVVVETADAELASATGVAQTPSVTLTTTAGHASATGQAFDATVSIAVEETADAGHASATGAALSPLVAVGASAGHAAAAGTSFDATVTTGGAGATDAPAGHASATGVAHNATALVGDEFATPEATVTANAVTAQIAPTAGHAAATGTAYNATTSVSADETADAGLASATGVARQPVAAVGASAGHAAATGIARQPSATLTTTAGQATATGTANNATVSTSSSANAPAGLASATATAFNATVQIAAGVGHASATGTAYQAQGLPARTANAGHASATAAAFGVTAGLGAAAGHASATGVARDVSAALQVLAALAAASGVAFNVTGFMGGLIELIPSHTAEYRQQTTGHYRQQTTAEYRQPRNVAWHTQQTTAEHQQLVTAAYQER